MSAPDHRYDSPTAAYPPSPGSQSPDSHSPVAQSPASSEAYRALSPSSPASSLPRYQSSSSLPPGSRPVSGMNPNRDTRYSNYSVNSMQSYNNNPAYGGGGGQAQGGPHPLSNAMYADSSPTLHESNPDAQFDKLQSTDKLGGQQSANYYRGPVLNSDQKDGSGGRNFRRISGAFVQGRRYNEKDDGPDGAQGNARSSNRKRLGYLDGMKFWAAMVVLTGTLIDNVVENGAQPALQRSSPAYIVRSTNLGIVMLLMLSARSILEPLWDVPASSSSAAGAKSPSAPSIAWSRTARAMLVRPFRFILPVLVVAALQWGLGATGKTRNANAVGVIEPSWGQISNFAGYATLVFDLFTWFELDTVSGKTFGANLWIVPWFFQSSYCAYVSHIMLGNLSSNRYWVYGALAAFSWFSFNFFFVAILGVVICDMAVHGQFRKMQKMNIGIRLALQLGLMTLGLVLQWINPVRNGLNNGMATVNVTGHTEITFADCILCFCTLFVVETSTWCQAVLGNIVMRMLGKLTTGLVLLSPAMVFTVVCDLALSMSNSNSGPSAILGVSWAVLFLACFGLAIVFHFLVELPSSLAGEYFADFVMDWGRADGTSAAIKEANKKARSDVKAPAIGARLKKAVAT